MSYPAVDAFQDSLPKLVYNVLVVDDEADVRAVTKLCLKNMKYKGTAVKVTEADSKAAAIKLLSNNLGHPYVCAIIDVVMESDHAGLELVEFIRGTLCNESMAIYLRTGQPGQAPEREVMEKLSLDGYVLKTELSDEKLYTLTLASIKSTLRAWPYENAVGQLGLFKFGLYDRKTFIERVDLAYKLADQLCEDTVSSFGPGHYFRVMGKEYSSGDMKGISEDVVQQLLTVPADYTSGPIEYRNYKELHSAYSQKSGMLWVGHMIEWTQEWKNAWVTFFQLMDHFVMQTKNNTKGSPAATGAKLMAAAPSGGAGEEVKASMVAKIAATKKEIANEESTLLREKAALDRKFAALAKKKADLAQQEKYVAGL